MLGDFGRNTVQLYTDSLEVFKEKMLEQEILFRNQVHELHRLYGVQRNLMKDGSSYQLESSSSGATVQLFQQAIGFPSNSMGMVSWRDPRDQNLFEGYGGNYHKFAPREFGNQLADQYVRRADNTPRINGNAVNHLKEIPDLNSPYQGDAASDSLELGLSLNPEVEDYRRNKVRRTLFSQKGDSCCSPIIIDLEESSETIMDEDAKQGHPFSFAAPTSFGGRNDSQVSNISNSFIFGGMKKDASRDMTKSSTFMEETKPCQEQNCYNKGFVDCHDNIHTNLPAQKQLLVSREVELVDLNKSLLDESSCLSDDTMIARPSTVEDKRADKSSDERSSIADNDSSSGKTMQSENSTLPAPDQFSGTNVGSQAVDKSSGEQDQCSFGSSESKHKFYKNKEDSYEVDSLIEQAAQSLVKISMEPPPASCNQNMGNEDQPQVSCDSYELNVLNLPETSVDEYCVSSKPLEFSDSGRKDCGFKLRRGRRMKDFQKDILPGISTLSRHEIYEDITILEGILRSREYKKMQSKMGNADYWSAPVRGRRSRASTAGRRKYR